MSYSFTSPGFSHALFPGRKLLLFLVSLLPVLLCGQRYFPDQAPLPADCQEWEYYQQLHRQKAHDRKQLEQLLERGQQEFSTNEYFYLQLALEDLPDRRDPILSERLGNPGSPYRQLIGRLISLPALLAIEADLIRINRGIDQTGDICRLRFDQYRPETSENRRAEILAYDISAGQVVAEIGAGDENFAASLNFFLDGLTVLVNDIDTAAVLRLAYHFAHNPVFTSSDNHFSAILGTGSDPGLGPVKADRIIIRNAIHHFHDPAGMLQSIGAALRPEGMVFLYERYAETCGDNCCPQLWSRPELLDLFEKQGFHLLSEEPATEKNRWILGFTKKSNLKLKMQQHE